MKEKTKYWVIADTHFGHDKMITLAGRPVGFEHRILKNLINTVKKSDVLIHLGDFCIGRDTYWHGKFHGQIRCKKWLIRGNHDRQTDTWYLNHGWDFVADFIGIQRYGKKMLLTHRPAHFVDMQFEINIHGHLHGDKHRHDEFDIGDYNKLVSMEHEYRPFDLRKVVGR